MKKKLITTTAVASLFSGFLTTQTAQALPLADIDLKAYYWQNQYTGEFSQNDQSATFEDLGLDKDSSTSFSLTLRHAVPLIPNVKIQQTDLQTSGSGTITQQADLKGVTFSQNENVTSNLDLSHLDITAFYSFLYFDLGLTGRNFDTVSSISDSDNNTVTTELNGWVPMLYLGVNANLPLTGLYIDASVNATSYDDADIKDYSAAVGYNLGDLFPLTAELGYRSKSLSIEDLDDLNADFNIDGWFLSLGLAL